MPFERLSLARRERLEARDATAACDALLAAAEQRDALWRAVAALPPRQQAMVVLRYYGDCSLAEIGQALGCRPGTVRATLHQALQRLRASSQTSAGDLWWESRGQPASPPIQARGEPEYER